MTRRGWPARLLRVGFLVAAVALLVWALVEQWRSVRNGLADIGVVSALGALGAVLLGLFFSALCWRALLGDLGSPLPVLPTVRVFFVGQLGKYLPGSVWPVLAQMELGRDHGLDRRRVGAAAVLFMGVVVTTGLLVGAVLLPFTSRATLARYWWVLLVLPVGLALLHPGVLTPLVARGLRLVGREPLDVRLSVHGMGAATGWGLAMWAAYGVHAWVLVHAVGASRVTLPLLATGAYALAWSAGFLFVVAPAGVGPREVAFVFALAPVLAHGPATAVALVSRLVMTVGDLLWGAAGLASARRRRRGGSDAAEPLPTGRVRGPS